MQQNQNHIRVVDTEGVVSDAEPPAPPEDRGKAAPRLRPTRALPSDRMKFDVQTEALRVYAVLSDRGKNAVSTDDLAARLRLASTTAGLVNGFFMEAGFIEREGKGRYKPTAPVVEYQRKYSFDRDEAARLLAPALRQSWYYREVVRQLDLDASEPRVLDALAQAAEVAVDERQAQLRFVLEWLEFAGMIKRDGGTVRLTGTEPIPEKAEHQQEPAVDPKQEPPAVDEHTETKLPPAPERVQVLGFDFEFSLTVEDLKQLSPEQITALFKAVGEVMAIKATLTE